MKAPLMFLFILLVIYNLTRKVTPHPKIYHRAQVNLNDQFIRVNAIQSINVSLIKNKGMHDVNAPVGDFLSRIWYYYGRPEFIGAEGFSYTFKDRNTDLIFTAYCAGSGPAYGGDPAKESELLPVIEQFDRMLSQSQNADCEITFDTDYGTKITGSKDGVPYDRLRTKK